MFLKVKEKKNFRDIIFMKDNFLMVKNMVKVKLHGLMIWLFMRGILRRMQCKGLELIIILKE